MESISALEELIERSGMCIQQINKLLGKSKSYIGGILANAKTNNTTISLRTLISVANACGYELVIAKQEDLSEDAIVIVPKG